MPRLNLTDSARKTLLFLGGFAGVIFETVHEHVDRPYLLALFGTMMGLPLFINRDPKHKDDDQDEGR